MRVYTIGKVQVQR